MIPVFCAEVFTEVTTATFDVTWSGSGTPFSVSWDVPAGLYWLGGLASPAAPALGDAFADELEAADPNIGIPNWSYTVQSLDPSIGAVGRLSRFVSPSIPTVTATNAAGEHVLWSLGFRNTSSIVMSSSTGLPFPSRYADTDGIPFATWWPKAHNTISDRFTPVSVAAFTSPLPGSGYDVGRVRMEPTTQARYWRTWRILPIDAARCSVNRATSYDTAWSVAAGLTSNPGDAALDNPDWWWSRVLDGSHRFAYIEDEAELVSGTPRYSIHRIVYDGDCPINMEPFKGLRPPILDQWSPAGSRQQFELAAIVTSTGNL